MQIRYKKIPVKTYYLQAKNMPCAKVNWQNRFEIIKKENIDTSEYRKIYSEIGKDFGWTGHLIPGEKRLAKILTSPRLHIYYLYNYQKVAGLIAFKEHAQSVELLYFGLIPEYIGKGLGKKFMQSVFYFATGFEQEFVELHTCEFDHPNALSFYLSLGFKKIKEQIDCEFYSVEFIQKHSR